MKHAFLIIAHNEFGILQRLISALDDERVDIFVHIDKKVRNLPHLYVEKSDLFFVKDRVDVRWGHISQIECEYSLFMEAYHPGEYLFYHLISGVHMPLKPVGELLEFFESAPGYTTFQGLCVETDFQETMKLRHYNIGVSRFAVSRWAQIQLRVLHYVQDKCHIRRHKGVEFHKASNWAVFTDDALKYLLDSRNEVLKLYRFSFCADEFFAPSLLMASPLKKRVRSVENLLKLEMGEASPRVLTNEDFPMLLSSGCLYGRKFSESHIDVVDRIVKEVHLK